MLDRFSPVKSSLGLPLAQRPNRGVPRVTGQWAPIASAYISEHANRGSSVSLTPHSVWYRSLEMLDSDGSPTTTTTGAHGNSRIQSHGVILVVKTQGMN
jgi:hypothetical protein